MPNPIDVLANQFKGFLSAAIAEVVAAERTAASAAELERVRQVANKLLEEGPYTDPTLRGVAAQAFDELFRRLAVSGDVLTAPLPGAYGGPYEHDIQSERMRALGSPSGTEPGGPYEDNSPEAIAERARLRREREETDRLLRDTEAEVEKSKADAKAHLPVPPKAKK
jgi:hypothetical protein